jgi:hypothetical protein
MPRCDARKRYHSGIACILACRVPARIANRSEQARAPALRGFPKSLDVPLRRTEKHGNPPGRNEENENRRGSKTEDRITRYWRNFRSSILNPRSSLTRILHGRYSG